MSLFPPPVSIRAATSTPARTSARTLCTQPVCRNRTGILSARTKNAISRHQPVDDPRVVPHRDLRHHPRQPRRPVHAAVHEPPVELPSPNRRPSTARSPPENVNLVHVPLVQQHLVQRSALLAARPFSPQRTASDASKIPPSANAIDSSISSALGRVRIDDALPPCDRPGANTGAEPVLKRLERTRSTASARRSSRPGRCPRPAPSAERHRPWRFVHARHRLSRPARGRP
jgi:hypothetical protein